jgi:transcriptional regulator with XRE-family HTH domain
MPLSPALSRSARALLDLDVADMVKRSGVPKAIISAYEKGGRLPQRQDIAALQLAFEEAGIVFLNDDGSGPGLRLRSGGRQVGLRPDQLTSENDD